MKTNLKRHLQTSTFYKKQVPDFFTRGQTYDLSVTKCPINLEPFPSFSSYTESLSSISSVVLRLLAKEMQNVG